MSVVRTAVQIIRTRPFIILFSALITLAFCLINKYNPVVTLLFGLTSITGGSIYETLISYLQILLDPDIIPMILLFIVAATVVSSILVGLIFSGYFNILNNALKGKKKSRGEFAYGIKKYYIKLVGISLPATVCFLLIVLFILISTVPAFVITHAASTGKPGLLAGAVFVDILTAGVLYLGFMLFRAYILFLYPAVVNANKKVFSVSRCMVNKNFWNISGKIAIFDIVFIVFMLLSRTVENQTVLFVVDWVFSTIFFVLFTSYIFSTFRNYSVSK